LVKRGRDVMNFKSLTILFILLVISIYIGCASTASSNVQLLKLGNNTPVEGLTKLVITEGPESKKARSYLRIYADQYMDLFARAVDSEGNIYVLPDNNPAIWTVISFVDLRQASVSPLNWTRYPVRTIDAASTEPAVAHSIRFNVHDQGIASPVVIEARVTLKGPSGPVPLVGSIKLD
jgi:hypothetical protein